MKDCQYSIDARCLNHAKIREEVRVPTKNDLKNGISNSIICKGCDYYKKGRKK